MFARPKLPINRNNNVEKESKRRNYAKKQPIVPKETTRKQIGRLLNERTKSTDNNIYIIGIFLKSDPTNRLFITSSTPFTLHTVNNTNINIKGTNILFFNSENEQIIRIDEIPNMIKDDANKEAKIIRTRMRDIYKKYNGLSTSQYAECQTISFSNDSNNSNDSRRINYTLVEQLHKEIDDKIQKEAEDLNKSITEKYGDIKDSKIQTMTEKSLPRIIITFRKYIEYLYRIPFMYKLNALTYDDIKQLYGKEYGDKTSTGMANIAGTKLLKELINFSYINLNFDEEDMNTVLLDNEIHTKYTELIQNDTEIYQKLNEPTDNKYIHILHFIDLIEIVWTNIDNIEEGNSIRTAFDNFYSMCINNILKSNTQIEKIYQKLTKISDCADIYPEMKNGNSGIPLRVLVDRLLSEKNSKDFITYLKINNTEGNLDYNQRYCLQLNQIISNNEDPFSTSMLLNYNANHNFPYYTKSETGVVTNAELDKNMQNYNNQFQQKDSTKRQKNDDFVIEKYDNQYTFGHYNRIFPVTNNPNSTDSPNKTIAKQMPEIVKQICENKKPVFMLGYGASGSGKTSSLIHLNKGNGQTENGVVVHLCEEIVKNMQYTPIKRIKVNIYEKYNDDSKNKELTCKDADECDVHTTNNKSVCFIVDGTDNVKFKSYVATNTRGTSNGIEYEHVDNVNIRNGTNEKEYIHEEKELGEVLKELVDVDRLVRATTNNRQSSRSHVIIGIHFYQDTQKKKIYDKSAYINSLFVGDLAGKENVFKCNDVNTILAFLNEEIGDGSPNKGKPFYSVLENIQTIKETEDTEEYLLEKQKHKRRIGNNKPVFSFSNPGTYFETDNNDNLIQIIKICLQNRNILNYTREKFTDVNIYEKIYKGNAQETKFKPTLTFMNFLDAYKRNCVYKPPDEKVQHSIEKMCNDYLKQRTEKLPDLNDKAYFSIFEILYLTLYENNLYNEISKVCSITENKCSITENKDKPDYVLIKTTNDKEANDDQITKVVNLLQKQSTLMYNKINHPSKPKTIQKNEYTTNIQMYIKEAIYQLITYHLLYIIQATNTKVSKPKIKEIIKNNSNRYDKLRECFYNKNISKDIAQDVIFAMKYEIRGIEDTPIYKGGQFVADYKDRTIKKLVNSGIFISNNETTSDVIPEHDSGSLPKDLLSIMINDFVFYDEEKKQELELTEYQKYLDELMNNTNNNHYREYKSATTTTKTKDTSKKPAMKFGGADTSDTVTHQSPLFPRANELKHFSNINSTSVATNNTGFKDDQKLDKKDNSKISILNDNFTHVILQTLAATGLGNHTDSPKEFYNSRKEKFHEKITTINKSIGNPFWYRNTKADKVRLVSDILTAINTTNKTKQKFNVFIIHKLDNSEQVIPIHKTFNIEEVCSFLYQSYKIILSPYGNVNKVGEVGELKYKTFFQTIFDDMKKDTKTDFYEYIDLFKKVDEVISETIERIRYGKEICNERLVEGEYINNSLDTMRQTIKTILTKKHKASKALFSSPTFVDQCLKSYCPTGINCFNTMSNTENANKKKLDSLFDIINTDLETVKDKHKVEDFYKDVVLCIFGVFNISRLADNPPKVPYIDINNLKRLFYNDNESIQNIAPRELQKVKELLKKLPMITLDDIGKNIEEYFQARKNSKPTVADLRNKLEQIIKKIDLHNASSSIGTLETVNTIAMLGNVDTICDKKSIYHKQLCTNLYTRSHDNKPSHTCKPPQEQSKPNNSVNQQRIV